MMDRMNIAGKPETARDLWIVSDNLKSAERAFQILYSRASPELQRRINAVAGLFDALSDDLGDQVYALADAIQGEYDAEDAAADRCATEAEARVK